PALNGFDERHVLRRHLRVELDRLLDPLCGNPLAEEVVGRLDGRARAERDPALDRDVLWAGGDVDRRVGPDEVVLGLAHVAREGFLPERPDLTQDAFFDRETVRVRIDVDHFAEARMRDRTVVALEVVLERDLPVDGLIPRDMRVKAEAVEIEAAARDGL